MKLSTMAATAALMLLSAGLAAAQGPGGGNGPGAAMRQACGADIQKYCGDKTERADRRACMMANKDKFSPDCKTALDAMQKRMQEMQADKPK
jgi:hypothetical protein